MEKTYASAVLETEIQRDLDRDRAHAAETERQRLKERVAFWAERDPVRAEKISDFWAGLEAYRKENAKRDTLDRAAEHAIYRSGACTGGATCYCPNCRPNGDRSRIFHGYNKYIGEAFRWKWSRTAEGKWRRFNLSRRSFFGPVYDPDDARIHNYKFPCNYSLKEIKMLSPIQLSILLWRYAHPNGAPYPSGSGYGHTTTILSEIRELEASDLVKIHSSGNNVYSLSERGTVLVNALGQSPLPVRAAAPWIMPSPDVGS
jgi:hypothetical protein